MLSGTLGVPAEFFSGGSPVSKVVLLGASLFAPSSLVLYHWCLVTPLLFRMSCRWCCIVGGYLQPSLLVMYYRWVVQCQWVLLRLLWL